MNKPFYTMEEACDKLSATEGDIKDLVANGSLREFRDAGKIFFKSQDVEDLKSGKPFPYEALNSSGQTVQSEIYAASHEDAVSKIRSLGYFPTEVDNPKRTAITLPDSITNNGNFLAIACISTFIVGFIAGALIMRLGAS